MNAPPLAELLRWVAGMPAAFQADPTTSCRVPAVVADLLETLFGEPPAPGLLGAFALGADQGAERNRLRWVLAAAHVLWHPAFREARLPDAARAGVERLLVQELATLAAVAKVELLAIDEERREELIRRTLRALKLSLPGESANEANDRLHQVDSVERQRVLIAAAGREKRAREVREAMARKAAEEAAAKVSRE